jgi:hypothetical protein
MKYLKNQFKIYNSVFAAIALFAIVSCSPARNDSNQSSQLPSQQNEIANTETEASASENSIVTDEIADPVSETTEQQATETNNDQVMINPPHGEPGHRCDIPVGQPLNAAAPANNTAPTVANNTNEQVMINPPHGEPGHRCDIPVGQPLNAAPAQQTTAPSMANNPMAPTIENARRMNGSQTRTTTQTNSGTKPRLNPPHGQPWHRCDIAVGSPLP